MEIKWLEDFLSLTETGSFSRSARERHVSQPAFSRRIKALELWLGVALVDRSVYPTRLTPAGESFLDTAEQLLRQLYQVRAELRRQDGSDQAALGIAILHTLAITFLPDWLRRIKQRVGDFRLRMLTDNYHDCLQHLSQGSVDFLLSFTHPGVSMLLNPSDFEQLIVGRDRLLPVTAPHPEHPDRPRYELPGSRRQPLPYLSYGSDAFLGRCTDLLISRTRQRCWLNVRCENAMSAALQSMALAGQGLAFLPETLIRGDLAAGRLRLAGSDHWQIPLTISLYRPVGAYHSPLSEAVWVVAGERQTDYANNA